MPFFPISLAASFNLNNAIFLYEGIEIKKDGTLWLVLDLNVHTLVDSDKPWDNYFLIAPGDTGSDFKRQRSGDELWVCTAYVDTAFQLLGMQALAYYDVSSNEMRVTIENDR